MLSEITNRITDSLVAGGIIEAGDREIYIFGAEVLISYIINLITAVVLGLALKTLTESLIFLTSYALIRMYAGGYHASTFGRCYALSVVIMIAALLSAVHLFPAAKEEGVALAMAVAGVGIWAIGPVDSKNKRITAAERKEYRQKTVYMLLSEALAAAVLHALGLNRLVYMIALAWGLMLAMCAVEKCRSAIGAKY